MAFFHINSTTCCRPIPPLLLPLLSSSRRVLQRVRRPATCETAGLYLLSDPSSPEPWGKVDLVQASAGWILGGEVYAEIVFFETEGDYLRFTAGNFEFSTDAKAVGLTASVGAKATTMGNMGIQGGLTPDETTVRGFDVGSAPEYTKGMKAFTLSLGGLMYQATVGGQKFNIK